MTLPQPVSHELPAPWWEQLPDDFCWQVERTEPGARARHRLSVHATAAMEHVMRVPLATLVAASAWPVMSHPGRAKREFEALRFYEPLARAGDASRVFLPPPEGVRIQERPGAVTHRRPDIHRFELCFDSPFEPLNPVAAPQFARLQRNRVACAQHWRHGDRPRPTLIVIHGFGMDSPSLNARMLGLAGLYDHGYDILLFTYPHHGRRAEAGSWFSGQGVFGRGLIHFNEVALHAIHDLRVFIAYLRGRGVEHIGVAGVSLGGYTASLLACVESGLDFCIPIVPGVSPIDAFLEWQPTGVLLSQLMRSRGVGVAEMRGLVAVHNPLTYAPRIDGQRVLIIGGAGDRVTAPRHLRLLQRHFPGGGLHWFPGNHLVHLGRATYQRRMRELMDRCTG
jgi:pimeloyl-ACP methyl ester carboxylesterase